MNQQINLYLPEFRPRKDWLNAARLLQGLVVVLVVMVLISAHGQWRLSQLATEREMLQQQLSSLSSETQALERRVNQRGGDERLQREVATREARLIQTRDMLEFLKTITLGNTEGFSEYLKDLSRASFSGLWLTEIGLADGGDTVSLQGRVEQSAMVPDFVGRLTNNGSVLQGRHFNRLSGNRRAPGSAPADDFSAGTYDFVLEAR